MNSQDDLRCIKTSEITRLREAKHWTRYKAAKMARIAMSQWTRIEGGETRSPRLSTLKAMAKALGVDLLDIVDV